MTSEADAGGRAPGCVFVAAPLAGLVFLGFLAATLILGIWPPTARSGLFWVMLIPFCFLGAGLLLLSALIGLVVPGWPRLPARITLVLSLATILGTIAAFALEILDGNWWTA